MTKIQFILALSNKLSALSKVEVEERLTFYSEMIEDRMEEGLSEEDAVAAVGSVEEIATQIVEEVPLARLVKEKITPKRKLYPWEIVLFWVGSPIWFSLLLVAFSVVLALYVSLWAVVLSLWASFGAVVVSALAGVVSGILYLCMGHIIIGLATVGAGLACAGMSIFFFMGCKMATKAAVWLTRTIVRGIKKCFVSKEVA